MRAIDRSDVVLMVINAEEGIREYDKRIAGFAHEAGKVDHCCQQMGYHWKDNHTMKQWEDDIIAINSNTFFMRRLFFVSALTKQRLHKVARDD